MRIAPRIVLSPEEEKGLRKLASGRSCSVRLAQRSAIVLMAAKGLDNRSVAAKLTIDRGTVSRWRHRYLLAGLKGIEKDAYRPVRRPSISSAIVSEVIEKTTRSVPRDATQWSRRTMAAEVGISASSVGRIWKRNGLKPHLSRNFKVSNDHKFSEKLEDIVGLYMNPPEHALVLAVDEKSQIQALDRTQPGLPLRVSESKEEGAFITSCSVLPLFVREGWVESLRRNLVVRCDTCHLRQGTVTAESAAVKDHLRATSRAG